MTRRTSTVMVMVSMSPPNLKPWRRRDLRQPGGARPGARQAQFYFRRQGRTAGQEYSAASPCIRCEDRRRDRDTHLVFWPSSAVAVTRQAVDRNFAVSEYEWRSGARIFCRRDGRGDYHGAQPDPLAVCYRP